ncbi:hypothetical protein M231_07509 [Tremella mesenterica]|uniref:Uncharacterized protein n=1 Tax=Tremella mesenterica TaxID=5217 RepID=A0A4Q1BFK7_TREME|nr:hypothetical protein M231_07509 [Tremella mesenterica]
MVQPYIDVGNVLKMMRSTQCTEEEIAQAAETVLASYASQQPSKIIINGLRASYNLSAALHSLDLWALRQMCSGQIVRQYSFGTTKYRLWQFTTANSELLTPIFERVCWALQPGPETRRIRAVPIITAHTTYNLVIQREFEGENIVLSLQTGYCPENLPIDRCSEYVYLADSADVHVTNSARVEDAIDKNSARAARAARAENAIHTAASLVAKVMREYQKTKPDPEWTLRGCNVVHWKTELDPEWTSVRKWGNFSPHTDVNQNHPKTMYDTSTDMDLSSSSGN